MTTGLPDDDLSDLGTPARGEGLKDFFDKPGADEPDTVEQQESPQEPLPREDQREEQSAEEPQQEKLSPTPAPGQQQRKRVRRTGPGTATIYMSESVRARLEDYRIKHRTTNLVVVLKAIEACGDLDKLKNGDVSQLQEVIEKAAVSTGYSGGLFSSNPKAVKYLGGGGAPAQFTPTPEQARELDELGKQLGFKNRSTWIAPILNEFLPGRKDKR